MLVKLSTDGSCFPNPGPGGWAAIFRAEGYKKVIYGWAEYTTNIQMEMTAVIMGLEYLKKPSQIELFTDSEFTLKGATVWLNRWKRNGFMTAPYGGNPSKPISNKLLWLRLDEASQRHRINWHWVRGHREDEDNLLCDSYALKARTEKITGEIILEKPKEEIVSLESPNKRSISVQDVDL